MVAVPHTDVTQRIEQLARISEQLPGFDPWMIASGRNRLTRFFDRIGAWLREYLPAVHWIGVALFALPLFVYCCVLGVTVRLVTAGACQWPELPGPCILALWHGSAPSLIAAIAAQRPRIPMVILISQDFRGDGLALLCRLLGLRVARGDGGHSGWAALAHMAEGIERGMCAIVTPDGGGPAKFAKPGAVALAAATGVPLLAIGGNCTPALAERHKWDSARNPLPFGRIAVAISQPLSVPPLQDSSSLEAHRRRLQRELDEISITAANALS